MAAQTEFIAAVNQISAERGIDPQEVLDAVAEAIKNGFLEEYDEESEVEIKVNIDTDFGQISVLQVKNVVEKVENEDIEISVKDAKKYAEDAEVGDIIELDITPDGDFGRVAAQSAKQVILQKVREAERETQLKAYEDRIGEIEYAVVQRMDGDSVIWEVGRTLAVMPLEDRIMSEFYKSGSRHRVLLKDIQELPRGKTLIVSRGSNEFLRALFELEVPELESGSVEIKNIAREPGSRAKIAVHSNVDGIDPIGSFVGQRGVRISSVTNELRNDRGREEKIDIITWAEDPIEYITNAISPAQVNSVKIVDESRGEEYDKKAVITVPNDQLSLAIGKDGQNVRLAARLTGWMIDIQGESGETMDELTDEDGNLKEEHKVDPAVAETEEIDPNSIKNLGLGDELTKKLEVANVETIDQLKDHAKKDFEEIETLTGSEVDEITEKLETVKE